jgi:hypothetical protein
MQRPSVIGRIAITANRFRKVGIAVQGGRVSVEKLFITHNDFSGYAADLAIPLRIDDAVIRWNRFVPGSYVDERARQGVVATRLGTSRRVDFSSNEADGASTEALRTPADAAGWSAGFTWDSSSGSEYLLVSENRISCSGGKPGDGEAIALRPRGDTQAHQPARAIVARTDTSVSIHGDRDSDYRGYWIQVVDGPGMGQTRRIDSYRWDPADSILQLQVSPAWDITPRETGSRVIVTSQLWQIHVVANEIDQSKSTCRKSKRNNLRAGLIVMGGSASDSSVERNRLPDTDGTRPAAKQ